MKVGIITAMPEEFTAVARSLSSAIPLPLVGLKALGCQVNGHDFLLVESGIGFDNATRAAAIMLRDGRPDLMISTGFCGGITAELQVGDVVVAKNIISTNVEGFEEIAVSLSDVGRNFVTRQAGEGRRIVGGTFVSASVVTSKVPLAAMLAGQYPNAVVEMESGAIAVIAAKNNIPLLALRVVSDAADEELGFSLDEFCDSELRRICIHKVLLTVLRKPRIIPQLVRLSRSSRRAAKSLTAALSRLFPTL